MNAKGFRFVSVRLGKDSVDDIGVVERAPIGVLKTAFEIKVRCTQVPEDYSSGDYAFIWLGSDNAKGAPTAWKQGFKAMGTVRKVERGEKYNDVSNTTIEVLYVFQEAVSRLDILRCAPEAYYWCSAMPLIGLDDHANQTIRCIQGPGLMDIRAFFCAIDSVTRRFKTDIEKIEPTFSKFFNLTLPSPQKYPHIKSLSDFSDRQLQASFATPLSLTRILYGPPGTGKSHLLNSLVGQARHLRTTFHPDSDYSTFVGAYKPAMRPVVTYLPNGTQRTEEQIVYRFVPQAFVKAYVEAWSNLAEPVFLLIEELNRGNCAQIFGDLFQLLDRRSDGRSTYPIAADDDLRRFLAEEAFADLTPEQREAIADDDILAGRLLALPPNLRLWATLNTSDQSLFPIDAAFKRRWEWTYVPIRDAALGWTIQCGTERYDWWQFLVAMNERVAQATDSEDKQMGYFFAQSDADGTIPLERFVGKVVFYLWTDVFRDGGFDDALFDDGQGGRLTFSRFFRADAQPEVDTVRQLFHNLGLEPLDEQGAGDEDAPDSEAN